MSTSTLAVDAEGGVFVGGNTQSTDFPLLNPYQSFFGGSTEGFLLRLDPTGSSLTFSTYLGGGLADTVADLAMGPDGRVVATGQVSYPFAFTNAYWGWYNFYAAFVARFDPNGVPSFVAGIGERYGSSYTTGHGVAVDAANNIWVTGGTATAGLATPDAFQRFQTSSGDAFIGKLSPLGALVYFTYLGGIGSEDGSAIAVDASGVSVTGFTSSPDFPVRNPLRSFHGGAANPGIYDGFVTKLQPTGASLVFSTFLGEPYNAWGEAIDVDPSGAIHVGGRTDVTQVPDENVQAYFASLNAGGSAIEFSTTLGGAGWDAINDLQVDATGDLWAVGQTSSSIDFPIVGGSYQTGTGGASDAFVLRYSNGAAPNLAGVLQLASGYGADERAGAASVSVGRIAGRSGEVAVEFTTGPGSALTPWDYTPVSGTLVFPDGVTTSSFSVPVFRNQVYLGDRDFSVSLTNPTGGAGLGRSTAPVTIREADPERVGLTATFRVRDGSLATGPAWNAFVDVPWITLSSYSGTGPSVATVTVSPAGLRDGTYTGYIIITANALGSPVVIPVTLSINCSEGC